MLWLPTAQLDSLTHNLTATPSANGHGATLTGGASNVKGSYADLVNPVPYDTFWATFMFSNTSVAATRTDLAVDIAIGPTGGGSEQIILPDLLAGWTGLAASGNFGPPKVYSLPLYIPKGVALRARCAGLVASDTVNAAVHLHGGANNPPWGTFTMADALGITNTVGTSVTSGNSGAEGSWAPIVASTTRAYQALMFTAQGTLADTTATSAGYHFEVGIGAAAAEVTLAEYAFAMNSNEIASGPWPPLPMFQEIPSGSRLAVRGECSGTAEAIDCALYGLY
jgi:hypothetical protein